LWAALRFGIAGISNSITLVAFLAILGAVHRRGPFTGNTPVHDVLSLQLFLLVLAASFMVLAAVVEERMAAKVAVAESEERLRLAVQAGRMFAYSWDVASDEIERSGEAAEILGVQQEAVHTGGAILSMVHPDDKKRLQAAVADLSPERSTLQITYRVIRPDGKVVWLERNSQAYFDSNGNLARLVGMVADVTERTIAEQALADMTRKLIEAQEQERSRIGRELHDDINQQLAMLAFEVEQLIENPALIESRGRVLQDHLNDISGDVQALSHDLHSSKLEYLGVVSGIKSWCKEFALRQKLEIDFRSDVSSPVSPAVGLCFFRILQEAIHNAVSHSGVRRVEVQLWQDAAEIHLEIKDQGRGFDFEQAMQGTGLGLTSMRERARLVNGNILISSQPGRGTSIHVCAPLEPEHRSHSEAV
jgi:PAS domain S-box-containing protein